MDSIDQFLQSRGVYTTPMGAEKSPGYISDSQKKQFSKRLKKHPNIRTILEIGFNGGHSAELFFKTCNKLDLFVSFDINTIPHTKIAAEYFNKKYKERFLFIEGDSLVTVPDFRAQFPNQKFDLIYIDGCHLLDWVVGDMFNTRFLAHENTLLWIDDVSPDGMNQVAIGVKYYEKLGVIRVEEHLDSDDPNHGFRSWVAAKFTSVE